MSNKEARRVYRKRLTIELLPEEEELIREARIEAVRRRSTLRDWVMGLVRKELGRDGER